MQHTYSVLYKLLLFLFLTHLELILEFGVLLGARGEGAEAEKVLLDLGHRDALGSTMLGVGGCLLDGWTKIVKFRVALLRCLLLRVHIER